MVPFPKMKNQQGGTSYQPNFSSPETCREHHLARAAGYPGRFGSGWKEGKGKDEEENNWWDEEDEIPVLMPRGSICVISSLVVHRSGGNISDRKRRIFMPQYRY